MTDFNTESSRRRNQAAIRASLDALNVGTRPTTHGPSRLGPHGSHPNSGANTPRMGSGTPRMGTPRARASAAARRRKRVLVNMFKLLLVVCLSYLAMRQVLSLMRYSVPNDSAGVEASGASSVWGGAADEDFPLGSDAMDDDDDVVVVEDYVDGQEISERFQNIIPRHGVLSDEQRDKLALLADVLLTEHTDVDIELFPRESDTSGVFAHPTSGISGEMTAHFYRMTNVAIKNGKIRFFGGPAMREPHPMYFDVTTTNSTSAKVPTTLLFRSKDGGSTTGRQSIDIDYLAARRGPDDCKGWINEPVFFAHSRYPDNMWHVWISYMGVFQTARELGYLNIHRIDGGGAVTRLGAGLPGDACPTVADLLTGAVKPARDCVHRRDVMHSSCSVEDTWCHPGTWPGLPGLGYSKDGPVVAYFDESNINAEWSSLLSAMSSKVRSFDALEGYCIRNLVAGAARSLKFEDKFHDGSVNEMSEVSAMESLANDLEDFVDFTRSALVRLAMNNAIEFLGYQNRHMEKLRAGIRLGQGSLIDKVYPAEKSRIYEAYFTGLDMSMNRDVEAMVNHPWAFAYQTRHIALVSEYDAIHKEAVGKLSPSPLPYARTRTYALGALPVVTVLSRVRTLNRAILNERQILRYIYWNYEVELRVTDLSENIDFVADTLASTDVLIGMHQPEWMSAIFLQPGAVTLQMHPYGWRNADGSLLRGGDVENIVHLRRGTHLDWVNPYAEFSFFRRKDFGPGEADFRRHPTSPKDQRAGTTSGLWSKPNPESPHQAWLYANTYADMNHLRPYIDAAMQAAGVPKLPGWKIDELKAIRMQIKDQMPESVRKSWLRGDLFSADVMDDLDDEEADARLAEDVEGGGGDESEDGDGDGEEEDGDEEEESFDPEGADGGADDYRRRSV